MNKYIYIAIAVIVIVSVVLSLSKKQTTLKGSSNDTQIALNSNSDSLVGQQKIQKEVQGESTEMQDDSNQTEVKELTTENLVVGDGEMAEAGDMVTVNYKGELTNGVEFDSSYKRNEPFVFELGAGSVIKGWDEGVAGMKVGGRRKLTIPPDMAYGDRGAGAVIPPNATLVFEVELLEVEKSE